jgi:glycolate oxidase FAD binding subunit
VATLAKELNLEMQILGEAKEFWDLLEIMFWQDELRNLAEQEQIQPVVCKLGILPSASVAFLKECEQIFDQQSYYLQIHAGSGLGILRVEDEQDLSELAQKITKVRNITEGHSGFLTILEAPQELKFNANVWGYTGNASDLMDKIRKQFDARGLLSPDRMFS